MQISLTQILVSLVGSGSQTESLSLQSNYPRVARCKLSLVKYAEQVSKLALAKNFMNYIFSNEDEIFMKIALDEAGKSFSHGDFPIGAVLVINGKLIDQCHNDSLSKGKWISHAETTLLNRNSALIKRESGNGAKVDLYATLEPCLMCFGTAVHHRLSRIIYACPDPNAGSTHIDPRSMKEVYLNMWPKIFSGLMKEKSCEMMIDFFRNGEPEEWKIRNAKLFENMKKEWE